MSKGTRQRTEQSVTRPSAFSAYLLLLKKDFQHEARTRQMISSMGLYAVLVVVVLGAALSQAGSSASIAPFAGGLIWVAILFAALLGLNRAFAFEQEDGCIDATLLAPVGRGVVYLAKATSTFAFLLAVEVLLLPLFYVFFLAQTGVEGSLVYAVLSVLVGTFGFAAVGVLLASMTVQAKGRDVLLAVLAIPLLFPLLYACASATTGALTLATDWQVTYSTSMALAIGYDIIMTLASWLLFDYAISA